MVVYNYNRSVGRRQKCYYKWRARTRTGSYRQIFYFFPREKKRYEQCAYNSYCLAMVNLSEIPTSNTISNLYQRYSHALELYQISFND